MKNKNLKIRQAEKQDIDLIYNYIYELARYENLEDKVTMTKKLLTKNLFNDSSVAEVLLLSIDDKDIGFVLFFPTFSTFVGKAGIYIEDLYIRPEFRNKGYGKKLMSHMANKVISRNYARLEWNCLDWNNPSLAFYKKLGAECIDEWLTHRLENESLISLANQI